MKKSLIIISSLTVLLIGLGIFYKVYLEQKKDNNTVVSTENNVTMDEEIDYDLANTVDIKLDGKSITIDKAGVYKISGTLNNGNILVNTSGNVLLILENASITNNNGPAILIEKADNFYIELRGDNKITSTTTEDLDGAIYSKENMLLRGDGTLNLTSNLDGIVSKDDLIIQSGTYNINTSDDGIRGKDSVLINDGVFNIVSLGDAIKSSNEEEKGTIYIQNGTFTIKAKGDGIDAVSSLTILDGKYDIQSGLNNSNTTDSRKGIKSDGNLVIQDGDFTISSLDDGIHTNSDLEIKEGNFSITSKDDAIHADGMVLINGGTYDINAAEGIEGTYVKINAGTINISASDDGINAGNKSSAYAVKVEINGGDITIKMGQGDTDGVDANGDIIINGGTISVTGQSTFDYDGTGTINGGTVICNGEKVTTLPNQMMGGGPNMNNGTMGGRGRR